MAFLGELGLVQRKLRPLEICAGILHVLIEKEAVEVLRQVVVVGNVPLRASRRVDLLQAAEGDPEAFDGLGPGGIWKISPCVEVNDSQKAEHVAFAKFQFSVHVGFRDRQRRIEGYCALCMLGEDGDMHPVALAVAELSGFAPRPADSEVAGSQKTPDKALQQNVHHHSGRTLPQGSLCPIRLWLKSSCRFNG
jgi:hypothetical protein